MSTMNAFLQRMLRKADDEFDEEPIMEHHQQLETPSRSKPTWIRKFSPSPGKGGSFCVPQKIQSMRPSPMPIERSVTFPVPQDPQKLGQIRKEFEQNYLSPTKHITPQDSDKTGKFVKKMVEAFEQKYKTFKDPVNEVVESRLKRRSLPTMSEARKNFFNETYVIETPSVESLNPLDDPADEVADSYNPLDETIDISTSSFMDEDPPTLVKSEYANLKSQSFAESCKSPIAEIRSPENERKPKIVGAFLKQPIEVEDTSIDWIPITGKKLPRKNSFKKLLSILTGRKPPKGSKLYCSQSQYNLNEEPPKEHHDSGYEEKSSSTSSLTSLTSFTEVLQRQDYQPEIMQRPMSTFHAPKTENLVEEQYQNQDDIYSETSSLSSRKFIFEEIPRSEVRLSLGPSFPLKNVIMRQASASSLGSDIEDYEFDSDITPAASPLPKHPFVSSKDDLDQAGLDLDSSGVSASSGHSSQDITQIEFRQPSWKFIDDDVYDTPRSYLSKSEPGLFNSSDRFSNCSFEGPVYDTPARSPPRPKSSVYEDALSLKRRNAHNSASSFTRVRSQFYAFQTEEEPHYATVKPRNIKILPSKDLLRSMANVSPNCRTPVSHYLAYSQFAGFQASTVGF